MYEAMEFDHFRFLRDKWGDPDRLVAFLSGYGHDTPRATVNQWFRRGSIPSKQFALLIELLKIDRGDVDLRGYLT